MAEHYGDVYICMHRADLLEGLVSQVPSERVRLNAKLVGLEERPDGVVAKLEDGDEVFGDIMVGADGLRSVVRTILFGEQEARFTSVAAWRGTIPMERMPEGFEHGIVTWPGRGRHAMTYPIRPDLQTFNGCVPQRRSCARSGARRRSRRSARLLRGRHGRRAGHHRPHRLGAHHADLFRDPLPVSGADRIIVRATRPTRRREPGQGAAQALEGSMTLAACLRRAGGPAGVPTALANFAARRQARTASMLISARTNLAMFNEPDPIQQRGRDGRLTGMLRDGAPGSARRRCSAGAAASEAMETPSSPCRRRPGTPQAMRAARGAARVRLLAGGALALEDRARLWVGEREGYERFAEATLPGRRPRRRLRRAEPVELRRRPRAAH